MNNEELLDRYRLKLMNLHLSTICVASFFEIIAYIILHTGGKHKISLYSPYFWPEVFIPIAINFTVHFIVRYVNGSKRYDKNLKNASVIYAILTTSCILTLLHRDYITTACTFSFPIVLSAIFCDKKLLKKTLEISIECLLILTGINCFTKEIDATFVLNQIVIYGINIISYLAALLTIDFTQNNLTVIQNQFIANRKLWHGIRRDQMTGLYNHVTFFSEFERIISDSVKNKYPFCLAMIDIDDFKKINDEYGHDNGDKVLLRLAEAMKDCCTPEDKIFRYGGEEFVIIFVDKNIDSAKRITENILTAFSNSRYEFAKIRTTFSCGLVQGDYELTKEKVFNEADKLMYDAKQSGKNRIIM